MRVSPRQRLIEETVGQMRRTFSRTIAAFAGQLDWGSLPMLPHITMHVLLQREGVTQRQLAEFLGVSTGYVTALVDGLEQGGLVRRRRDTTDRRVVHVETTPAGRRAHERAHDHGGDRLSILFDGWPDRDIRTFQRFLARMAQPPRGEGATAHRSQRTKSG
jgi:DNA-binding MarR family transcriptional regulator